MLCFIDIDEISGHEDKKRHREVNELPQDEPCICIGGSKLLTCRTVNHDNDENTDATDCLPIFRFMLSCLTHIILQLPLHYPVSLILTHSQDEAQTIIHTMDYTPPIILTLINIFLIPDFIFRFNGTGVGTPYLPFNSSKIILSISTKNVSL